MPRTTCCTAGNRTRLRRATGTSHIPRTTSARWSAIGSSTMTTDALRGIAAHMPLIAVISPEYVVVNATLTVVGLMPSGPPLAIPSPSVVMAAGSTRDAAPTELPDEPARAPDCQQNEAGQHGRDEPAACPGLVRGDRRLVQRCDNGPRECHQCQRPHRRAAPQAPAREERGPQRAG